MSKYINIPAITDSIWSLYKLYQTLEVYDGIDEDNPAFDFLCDITEGIYNTCVDLMSLTYEHPGANDEMRKEYKQILDDIRESYEDFLDAEFGDNKPKFY